MIQKDQESFGWAMELAATFGHSAYTLLGVDGQMQELQRVRSGITSEKNQWQWIMYSMLMAVW